MVIHVALGAGFSLLARRAPPPDEHAAGAPIEIETIVTTPRPAPLAAPAPPAPARAGAPPRPHDGRHHAPGAPASPREIAAGAVASPPPATIAEPLPGPAAAAAPAPGVDLRLRSDPFADGSPTAVAAAPPGAVDLRWHPPAPDTGERGAGTPKKSFSMGSDLLSMGDLMKSWAKDPEKHARTRDGTVQLFHATVDATDILMRAHGQDPYRREKAQALDASREQRLATAVRERSDLQRQALLTLPATLRQVWNDRSESPQRRREKIFQLWDECDEPRSEDDEDAAAGAQARRAIAAFIRMELAANTDRAYRPEEIASLNAHRQSRQRFDPYGTGARWTTE